MKWTSVKTQLAVFLAAGALLLGLREHDARFLISVAIAVLCALAAEALAGYIKNRRIGVSQSALVSGLIIGYVLSSDQPWQVFLAASGAAVASKHLIRFGGRHIFNPAGFGILFSMVFMHASSRWTMTYLWYIIVPVGFWLVYRTRTTGIIAGYASLTLLLFGAMSFARHTPLRAIFGYLSYFFIFVMLIEPKTSAVSSPGKFCFGAGAALFIFVLTEAGAGFDAELASLILMNMAVPVLNRIVFKNAVSRV